MHKKTAADEAPRSKRPRRHPKVVDRPSPATFRTATARLDQLNEMSDRQRRDMTTEFSGEGNSPTRDIFPMLQTGRRTGPDSGNAEKERQEAAFSSKRASHASSTYDAAAARSIRYRHRVILDSEDDDDDEEDCSLARGPVSSARKRNNGSTIQHDIRETSSREQEMSRKRLRSDPNIDEDDLRIKMHGWNPPTKNELDAPRRTRAGPSRKAPPQPMGHHRRRDQTPTTITLPFTSARKRQNHASERNQSSIDQDVIKRPSVQGSRPMTSTRPINNISEVKGRKSHTYKFVELNPLLKRKVTRPIIQSGIQLTLYMRNAIFLCQVSRTRMLDAKGHVSGTREKLPSGCRWNDSTAGQ